MVKTMAKLSMAHASTHGARKPPGPKCQQGCCRKCINESNESESSCFDSESDSSVEEIESNSESSPRSDTDTETDFDSYLSS